VNLRRIITQFAALMSTLCAMEARAGDILTLSAEDQARYGVSTITLEPRTERSSYFAIIRSVDPLGLFALAADIEATEAAAISSGGELRRLENLAKADNSASLKSVQAAHQQAEADASRLTLLKRRLSVEWGPSFSAMPPHDLSVLLGDIAAGAAAFVRADIPLHPEGAIGDIEFPAESGAAMVRAATIGLSGSADPRMQTVGLYGVVRGEAASTRRPGRQFPGEVKTAETANGVVIPRDAIVRLDGEAFAYAMTGEETFERRPLSSARMIADGWFVTEGFSPGESIVASGAGALVAAERGADAEEAD